MAESPVTIQTPPPPNVPQPEKTSHYEATLPKFGKITYDHRDGLTHYRVDNGRDTLQTDHTLTSAYLDMNQARVIAEVGGKQYSMIETTYIERFTRDYADEIHSHKPDGTGNLGAREVTWREKRYENESPGGGGISLLSGNTPLPAEVFEITSSLDPQNHNHLIEVKKPIAKTYADINKNGPPLNADKAKQINAVMDAALTYTNAVYESIRDGQDILTQKQIPNWERPPEDVLRVALSVVTETRVKTQKISSAPQTQLYG